jgi:hypothetical protein
MKPLLDLQRSPNTTFLSSQVLSFACWRVNGRRMAESGQVSQTSRREIALCLQAPEKLRRDWGATTLSPQHSHLLSLFKSSVNSPFPLAATAKCRSVQPDPSGKLLALKREHHSSLHSGQDIAQVWFEDNKNSVPPPPEIMASAKSILVSK